MISVIIPCYNVENYIERCVASVLEQEVMPLEIICVNNNSTDNTAKLLVELAQKHKALKVLDETRKGANYARNKGLSVASGEWIQFLDADDTLLKGKLDHQIKIAVNASKEIAFIAAACLHESIDGQQTTRLLDEQVEPLLAVFVGQSGNTCSNLWRKSALIHVGGWDESLQSSQEAELMMRLILHNYQLIRDNTPLTLIYDRPDGQISQTNHESRLTRYLRVRLHYLNQLKLERKEGVNSLLNGMYDFLSVTILQLAAYHADKADEMFRTEIKPFWKPSGKYGMSRLKGKLLLLFGPKVMIKLLN